MAEVTVNITCAPGLRLHVTESFREGQRLIDITVGDDAGVPPGDLAAVQTAVEERMAEAIRRTHPTPLATVPASRFGSAWRRSFIATLIRRIVRHA
ncbi:hypothetical protein RNZ50_15635 [Paracoccaceae bacterium Fryx2]|nr:hypothetical protein [Paracoccaceae bacterium Fryx2]